MSVKSTPWSRRAQAGRVPRLAITSLLVRPHLSHAFVVIQELADQVPGAAEVQPEVATRQPRVFRSAGIGRYRQDFARQRQLHFRRARPAPQHLPRPLVPQRVRQVQGEVQPKSPALRAPPLRSPRRPRARCTRLSSDTSPPSPAPGVPPDPSRPHPSTLIPYAPRVIFALVTNITGICENGPATPFRQVPFAGDGRHPPLISTS